MGYMSSCVSPNLAVALAVGPTIFIPLMNFGGFYQNAGSIPVWLDWMKYISLWDDNYLFGLTSFCPFKLLAFSFLSLVCNS